MFASIHNLPPDELYQKAIIFKELEDYDNYIVHLTMAANLNYTLAIQCLENDYRNEHKYMKQDYSKTINFYETTIEYGFSANNLAWMFANGLGVAQDYSKAIELYQMAIQKENSDAMNNLAILYEKGRGVPQNYDQAIKLYQMAIKNGNSDSMNNLALVYEYGKGVPQDYNQAIKFYQMAIEKGHLNATYNLADLYEYGKGVPQDYNLMKKYYVMAIGNGHSGGRSINRLKDHYMNNKNDLSIIDLYDNKYFHDAAKDIINTMFKNNLCLPEQYKQQFVNLRFDDGIHKIVKRKQFILKKTNMWPSNYDDKYLLHFLELLSIASSDNKPFCKDIILYIAGSLFV